MTGSYQTPETLGNQHQLPPERPRGDRPAGAADGDETSRVGGGRPAGTAHARTPQEMSSRRRGDARGRQMVTDRTARHQTPIAVISEPGSVRMDPKTEPIISALFTK